MEMLLSGELISAEKAEKIGLINKVVPSESLNDEVLNICKLISEKSAEVVAQGKKSFYKQMELGLSEAYTLTSESMVKNLELNDANEGISAFLEKRKPKWTDD
jgi:enoyl-CoA hydratase/carnithine racemase